MISNADTQHADITGGREANMDEYYDFQAEEERRERALWGGRIPTKPVTCYCGDCGTRTVGQMIHAEGCINAR